MTVIPDQELRYLADRDYCLQFSEGLLERSTVDHLYAKAPGWNGPDSFLGLDLGTSVSYDRELSLAGRKFQDGTPEPTSPKRSEHGPD